MPGKGKGKASSSSVEPDKSPIPSDNDDDIESDDSDVEVDVTPAPIYDVNGFFHRQSTFSRQMNHAGFKNAPCGCSICVVMGLLYGVAKVERVRDTWSAKMISVMGIAKVDCVAPSEVREKLAAYNGNHDAIAQAFDVNNWRALTSCYMSSSRHHFTSDDVIIGATKKRKPSG